MLLVPGAVAASLKSDLRSLVQNPTLVSSVLAGMGTSSFPQVTLASFLRHLTLTPTRARRFVPLVFGLFGSTSEALQMAGADVLAEIVAKRMEPVAKLALVQQLRVAPVCARWRDTLPGASLVSNELLAPQARPLRSFFCLVESDVARYCDH